MERTFFGTSLLRKAGRAFLLATLVGSVACGGCDDDPPSDNNTQPDMGNNNNNDAGTNNDTGENNNNPDPGAITVAPTMLTVSENGGTASFSVSLDVDPSMGDVVVNLTSGDEGEAMVSPAQLTFTASGTPQTVTVTGVDDDEFDGPQTVTIQTDAVGTGNYAAVDPQDVTVTVNDDDMASGSVTPTAIVVRENGADGTFEVTLGAPPTGDVTIPISVSDDTEIAVDVTDLTFTAANYDTAQTVTVSGIDDQEVEPDLDLQVIVGVASGGGYDGIDLTDVDVTLIDDDQASVTVTPTAVTTSENRTTGTFDVTLSGTPTDTVTIDIMGVDASEHTVLPASFDLTDTTPQTITVTGLDDSIVDGAVTYQVSMVATSNDGAYDAISIPSVALTNTDNDTPGVTVTPTLLTVNETGPTSADFTVALTTDPGETVTVDLALSDATQASLSTNQLTFDDTNFGTPQTVTVTAIDDAEVDGNVAIQVQTTMNATAAYMGVDPADVTVNVIDNDQPSIIVSPENGLQTGEDGTSDQFTIVLGSQPTADVTIALSSSDTTEGTVNPASVTFTSGTWQTAQTITVTGVDDLTDDGTITYTIITAPAVSTDAAYNNVNPSDVIVQNVDDDQAGFNVTPLDLTTSEDGTTATFEVSLTTPPTDDVSIPIQVTDSTEGSVQPQSLTFDTVNWQTPQVVTVTGLDDSDADGPVTYFVILDQTTSLDLGYHQLDPPNVTVVNNDNEAGFTVTPTDVSVSESGANSTVTVSIRLNSPPNQNIQIGFNDLTGSQGVEYDFSPPQMVFTPANWNTERTLTINGVPDAAIDGDQGWELEVEIINQINGGLDPDYEACQIAANMSQTGPCYDIIDGTTTDSDSLGYTVSPTEFPVTEGECEEVTVTLNTDSLCTGGLSFNVGDPLPATSELVVSPSPSIGAGSDQETFTIASGGTTATFYVCATQDITSELAETEAVVLSPFVCGDTSNPYHDEDPADLSVTINDDDTPAVIFTPEAGSFGFSTIVTNENGTNTPWDQFGVRLATPPTSSVIVTITSNRPDEALLSDNAANTGVSVSLVFQPSDWFSNQFIRVIGQDDTPAIQDGAQTYELTVTVTSPGGDVFYDALAVASLQGVNLDNDTDGWASIVDENPPEVSENDTSESAIWLVFTNTAVTQDVQVTTEISDDTEAEYCTDSFAPCNPTTSLTTSTVTWNGPGANGGDRCPGGQAPCFHAFGVLGIPDMVADGNQSWNIGATQIITTDPQYAATTWPTDLTGTTIDADDADLLVSCTANNMDEPDVVSPSTDCTFSLSSEPTDDVNVAVTSSDTGEAVVGGGSITLTSANYQGGVTITVSSVADDTDDGDQQVQITGDATSNDGNFDGDQATIQITINDIDNGTVDITALDLQTDENGDTGSFAVRLSTIPTDDVVIPVYSFDPTEGTVSTGMLTFTPGNWNTPQQLVVTGQDDAVNDGTITYIVCFDIPTSNDPSFDGDPEQCFNLDNIDDDFVGVTVKQPTNPNFLITDELGASQTFTVRLNTAPATGEIVELQLGRPDGSGSDCDENDTDCYAFAYAGSQGNEELARISPHTVIFDDSNWSDEVTITVTGQNDTIGASAPYRVYQVPIVLGGQTTDPQYIDHYDPGTGTCPNVTECYAVPDVLGANVNNDHEGIVVFSTALATTGSQGIEQAVISGESGNPGMVYIRAAQQPEGPVTLSFTATGGGLVTLPADFIIDGSNYNTVTSFALPGVDDGNSFQAAGFTGFDFTVTSASTVDGDYDGFVVTLDGYHSDNDACALTVLPTGSIPGGTGDISPFALLSGAAPPTVAVDVQATFSANLSQTFGAVNFNSAHQIQNLQAYPTGGAWSIDFDVNTGDPCYTAAGTATVSGTN